VKGKSSAARLRDWRDVKEGKKERGKKRKKKETGKKRREKRGRKKGMLTRGTIGGRRYSRRIDLFAFDRSRSYETLRLHRRVK
jgi:hypothetical protein